MKGRRPYFGYLSRRSVIHRLNPLTKLSVLVCFAILTVALSSDVFSLGFLAFLLFSYFGAGISLRYVVSRLRSILAFALMIAVVQLVFTSYGIVLFFLIPPLIPGFGPFFPITMTGVANAIVLGLRLINIVLASSLFIATTDPTLFAVALTRLRIPYRYSFTLVLTLRLVPLFDQESSIVQNAQRTRGIPVDRGVIRGFLTKVRYTFFPLIFSALSRVDNLTLAMDGRGFGYAKTRTYHRQPSFGIVDWVVTLAGLIVTSILLWIFPFVLPLPRLFA
ncbi:MAG: energy-coupling factor transporter transmembrane component T family protein [Promethearchaeota archaeon]